MITPRKGLRNLKTMANKSGAVQSAHEAFLMMATLHREKQRHMQELGTVTNRLNELTLRIEQIDAEQVALARTFDMPMQAAQSKERTELNKASHALSQGFKFRY